LDAHIESVEIVNGSASSALHGLVGIETCRMFHIRLPANFFYAISSRVEVAQVWRARVAASIAAQTCSA